MRLHEVVIVLLGSVLMAPIASACSPRNPIPSPRDLVNASDVILWARARELSVEAGDPAGAAGDETKVEFTVVGVLKGKIDAPTIAVNGHLEERDDPNDHDSPYEFVRPGGRKGNCFALGYRRGADYLLLLERSESGDLTPYWSPLAPTNEQLSGADDPWMRWVRAEVKL